MLDIFCAGMNAKPKIFSYESKNRKANNAFHQRNVVTLWQIGRPVYEKNSVFLNHTFKFDI